MKIKDVLHGIELGQVTYFVDQEACCEPPLITEGKVRALGTYDGREDVITVAVRKAYDDEEYRRIHAQDLFTEEQIQQMIQSNLPSQPELTTSDLIRRPETRKVLAGVMFAHLIDRQSGDFLSHGA